MKNDRESVFSFLRRKRREEFVTGAPTGDDSVTCGLCGKQTSVAMIAVHLYAAHEIDPADIADAPVVDLTEEA